MVDAVASAAHVVGLALKIKHAVDAVRQNKEACVQINGRVERVHHTLTLHEDDTELMGSPAVSAALAALGEVLGKALELVTACQEERGFVCLYCTAGKLTEELSRTEQRISNATVDAMFAIMSYQCQALRRSQGIDKDQVLAMFMEHQASAQNQDGAHPSPQEPERGSAVPKFGQWDGKDPSTGEGFTAIFNKLREEKQCGSGNASIITSNEDYMNLSSYSCSQALRRSQGIDKDQVLPKFVVHQSLEQIQDAAHPSPPEYYCGKPVGASPQDQQPVSPAQKIQDFALACCCPTNLDLPSHQRDRLQNGKMDDHGEPCSLVHQIAEVARRIKVAVEAVRRNKEECVEIDRRASTVSAILLQLENTAMAKEPAMSATLEKLLETFHHAYTLVTACQRRWSIASTVICGSCA